MWTDGWLYAVRATWNWLYIVPLSFAIIVLSFVTTGFAVSQWLGSRKLSKSLKSNTNQLRRIADGLENVSSRLEDITPELKKDTKELEEKMDNVCDATNRFRQSVDNMRKGIWWR